MSMLHSTKYFQYSISATGDHSIICKRQLESETTQELGVFSFVRRGETKGGRLSRCLKSEEMRSKKNINSDVQQQSQIT